MTIRLGSPDFLRMFPTVVWTLQLDEEATGAINPGILRRVAEIRASAAEPSAGENWQSGHALHRRDEFHPLVEAIHATTRKVLSFLEIATDDFEITGCWANVNGIGASHGVHTHPNNFLSGVYCVQTQAGADTINFHDPRVQTAILRPPVKALTADNTDQVVVRSGMERSCYFRPGSPTLSIPIGAPESASASASISCSPPAPRR